MQRRPKWEDCPSSSNSTVMRKSSATARILAATGGPATAAAGARGRSRAGWAAHHDLLRSYRNDHSPGQPIVEPPAAVADQDWEVAPEQGNGRQDPANQPYHPAPYRDPPPGSLRMRIPIPHHVLADGLTGERPGPDEVGRVQHHRAHDSEDQVHPCGKLVEALSNTLSARLTDPTIRTPMRVRMASLITKATKRVTRPP